MTRTLRLAWLVGAAVAAAACDSTAGPGATEKVEVRFRAGPAELAGARADRAVERAASGSVSLVGSNGTLTLKEAWIVVGEFELEGEEGACERSSGDDCEEFEGPPFFTDLPLDDGTVTVATDHVPPGVYSELEFEVEDLDDGDEDDGKGGGELLGSIRAQFADWPAEASMLVVGSFTPSETGEQAEFRVYFDAEIEVEMDLVPPLTVGDSGDDEAIVVEVDPASWFMREDGTVWDLSRFDYDETGDLLEFEAELERGFRFHEVGGDD